MNNSNFDTEFKPCPRCGSPRVEWTNCRDLNTLTNHVSCLGCELMSFSVETVIFLDVDLPNLDYETTLMKYNVWVDTNPKRYCEEFWD